jgi:hypothetical protein
MPLFEASCVKGNSAWTPLVGVELSASSGGFTGPAAAWSFLARSESPQAGRRI